MDKLINPFQTAFVKGRRLIDNFWCAHLLGHHLQSTKTQAAIFKIDFERAFDHINWIVLRRVLIARGFGDRWIRWIEELLSTASTVVLLNGVPGRSFRSKRGLRQGDPLSPFLFILCVDVLFRMLQSVASANLLPTVGIGDCNVHTLQFADDLLLFFDGTLRSASIIRIILDSFAENSGLKINFDKSSLIPINLVKENLSDLVGFLGCPPQSFPLIYLGLPLSPSRLRKADYLPLLEKLDKRLAAWKGSTLSRGGRLVLLNSVLSAIPTFFCYAFQLPSWVVDAIEKIRQGFFWRGSNLSSGFHCLVK